MKTRHPVRLGHSVPPDTNINTDRYTCTHVCIYTYMDTYISIYVYTWSTCVHICMQVFSARSFTYIHTFSDALLFCPFVHCPFCISTQKGCSCTLAWINIHIHMDKYILSCMSVSCSSGNACSIYGSSKRCGVWYHCMCICM